MKDEKVTQDQVVEFLASTIKSCCVLIEQEDDFSFDCLFEIGNKKYRLTLAEEPNKFPYLKEN